MHPRLILQQTRKSSIEYYRRVLNLAADKTQGDIGTAEGEGRDPVDFVHEAKRRLGRDDLFFLLTVLLHRRDMNQDWLFDRCREIQANPDGYIDLWARDHYKLQMLDEPTPTPTGWKKHGDLIPGDEIFGPDGDICRVSALNKIVTDAECYEIEFDDGFKIKSGGEHLWPIERRTRKRIPMAYNKPGPKRLYRETVLLQTQEIAAHDHRADKRLAVRVNDPLVLPEASLPIAPYLLGCWLGDGTSATGAITCGDDDVWREIEKTDSLRKDRTPHRNAQYRTIEGLSTRLRALGLIKNKHIPPLYLRGSKAQRLALLQGLMDTDGHCDTRGTATFVNTNDALVDGFCELANTLGLKPRRRRHVGSYKDKPYPFWQVSFQAYKEFPPFRIKRKLARCNDGKRSNPRRYIVACRKVPSVPMRCIQVDREDGLYLTGDSMVPTHNSTIITFGLTIQDILNDPELTFGFLSVNRPTAKKFLVQIKNEFEDNGDLKALYPDILWANPKKDAPKWSEDDGITVRRKGNPKEQTIEAYGLIDGLPTGPHFSRLIYDDVVTEDFVSPAMIEKVTTRWELSTNIGTEGGKVRIIGTRYHAFDTYQTIIDRGAAIPRIYPATHDGTDRITEENVVFRSVEFLKQRRIAQGPFTFACQMLQNPSADKAMGFRTEWLKYWSAQHASNLNVYIVVDPASKKKKTSDYTVMWVIGLGADKNYYKLDVVRDRLSLTERAKTLFDLHKKWKPIKVGYESYGLQADIEHMEFQMDLINYRFDIVELGGSLAKEDRILKLVPVYEEGRMYMMESCLKKNYEDQMVDLTRAFVQEEYEPFPVSKHDDMLDCEARILDPDLGVEWPIETTSTGMPDWADEFQNEGDDWMTA